MENGFADIGKVYDVESLREELAGVDLSWAEGVTVHHTAFPNLDMRPKGFTVQHMRNAAWGYQHDRGWSSGPHLFVDEDQAFGMCPLGRPGVHARSFNQSHIGVELLGDYDSNYEVNSVRGRQVISNGSRIIATICDSQNWDESSVNMHRNDPKTRKTCPGAHFPWLDFKQRVASYLEDRGETTEPVDNRALRERIAHIEWQLAQMKQLL